MCETEELFGGEGEDHIATSPEWIITTDMLSGIRNIPLLASERQGTNGISEGPFLAYGYFRVSVTKRISYNEVVKASSGSDSRAHTSPHLIP